MSHTVLQAKNISWSVDQLAIIQHIDLCICARETVAIVGPNGAGKTSLLKCLYGEHRNYSGQISIKGKPLEQISPRQLAKKIAVVSQHAESVFNLTALDIVSMGLIPHKGLFDLTTDADHVKIAQALNKVDLADKQHQYFNTLSGGEQQRVLIARAIVQSPDLLIMDEPTNHLDIYYQHQILQLAKKLNITLLLTIHDLNLAAQYCDRIILMANGRLFADDTPDKVFNKQLLSKVFKLDCHIDKNPFTQSPRITFSGNSHNNQQMNEPSSAKATSND
jgi:iron complex transport system ATP-binding protein